MITTLIVSIGWFTFHTIFEHKWITKHGELRLKWMKLQARYEDLKFRFDILNDVVTSRSNQSLDPMEQAYMSLGLRRDASIQEVKNSYRTLIKKYHPDLNKTHGAVEKFRTITTAYTIITKR